MKNLSLWVFLVFLQWPALALEQFMLEVENQIKGESHLLSHFYLNLNSAGDLIHIEQRKYIRGELEPFAIEVYTLDQLAQGVVLKQHESLKVAELQSFDLLPDQGGWLQINYLNNGVTGHYQQLKLQLAKGAEGWRVFSEHQMIHKLILQPNWVLFLGTIGIDEIEVVSPPLLCTNQFNSPC